MTQSKIQYKSWKEFFNKNFEGSKKYYLANEKKVGSSIVEEYVAVDKNDETIISICYYENKLLYWKFENPKTKGFTKQQEVEYFYRFDFTEGKSYGNPGLEFIDNNVNVIQKQFYTGLQGKEIQYYKNGEHIKSLISVKYYDNKEAYPEIVYFQKRSFWQKISKLFSKSKPDEFQTKEIDLNKIFGGI